MLIELGIFTAVCCVAVALCIVGAVVTLYRRQRDVLHGPYIEKRPWEQKRRV